MVVVAGATNQASRSNQIQIQSFASKPLIEVDVDALITFVRDDMILLKNSGQWLLSCYAPFENKQLFPGFQDQSFEEVRLACYEAQKTNTFEQYKQQLQQALQEVRTKFKALQNPSKEIIELLKNIYNTPPAANSTNSQSLNSTFGNKDAIGSPFGGSNTFGQSSVPQVGNPTSNSIFGQNSSSQVGNTSSNLFGQNSSPLARNQTSSSIFGQNSVAQVGNSASNSIFGQNSSPQVGTASAGSIFGQNLTTQVGNASSGSIFGQSTGQSPTTQVFSPQNSGGIFGQQSSPFGQNSVFGNTNQSVFNTAAPQNTNNLPNTTPHQTNLFQTNQGQGIFPGGNHAQTNPSNMQVPQPEPAKSVFGNTSQGNTTGNIFGSSVNMDAYSKLEDLSEADINWFKSNDLNIEKIPEKPPTYEMCFN
ncbi:hypothetical protein HHI36_015902 [Cryptolaemus montrouzieri]|uniref:Uncharacterized protein n=1 Tax=Cryptolaemus montrouzieri TaxID=559131 RepID=A0ABD2N8B7_9CUCU